MIVGTLGRKHKGQALTEMLITFAWGIPLLLVIVQLGMLYRTKATLNDATFRAAREGSLHHAYTAVMEDALVRGMMPSQYAVKPGNKPSLLDYELSKEKMVIAYKTTHAMGAKVEVVSPTQAIFQKIAKRSWVLRKCPSKNGCPHRGSYREVAVNKRPYQIPNDNLKQRSTHTVKAGGVDINIQDANLLRIRSTWCEEMKVPVVNGLIWNTLDTFGGLGSPKGWNRCKAMGALHGGYYLPLSGHAMIRMQTPVQCEGNVTGNKKCKNLK